MTGHLSCPVSSGSSIEPNLSTTRRRSAGSPVATWMGSTCWHSLPPRRRGAPSAPPAGSPPVMLPDPVLQAAASTSARRYDESGLSEDMIRASHRNPEAKSGALPSGGRCANLPATASQSCSPFRYGEWEPDPHVVEPPRHSVVAPSTATDSRLQAPACAAPSSTTFRTSMRDCRLIECSGPPTPAGSNQLTTRPSGANLKLATFGSMQGCRGFPPAAPRAPPGRSGRRRWRARAAAPTSRAGRRTPPRWRTPDDHVGVAVRDDRRRHRHACPADDLA